jgi:hypothetical protein
VALSCGVGKAPHEWQHAWRGAPAPHPIGGTVIFFEEATNPSGERIRKSGDELDQISLTPGAGLFEHVFEVELDRVLSHAECFGYLGHTPPTLTMASSTRSSLGVSLNVFAMASGGEGVSNAALCTNTAAAAA